MYNEFYKFKTYYLSKNYKNLTMIEKILAKYLVELRDIDVIS